MILIAAVDDRYGMLFHERRQSQDRKVRERILALSRGSRLWISQYTAKQFTPEEKDSAELCADDAFLSKAAPGEFCFVENVHAAPYAERIERVILFKWNRSYPGDFFFDIDLADGSWKLSSAEEFSGFSHEKITMEVYVR